MSSSLIDQLMGQGGTALDTGNIDLGQKPSKVDSIMQSGNKIDAIMQQGGLPYDRNRLAPRQVDVSQIPEEPGMFQRVLEHIAETLKEQGLSAIQFGKYSLAGGLGTPAMPVPSPNSKVFQDAVAASEGDLEAQQRIHRGIEGAALVGSIIAGEGALAALKPAAGVAAPVLRRFAAWLGAQEAAAVTYGSIQPLDDKQSRAEAIAQDMRDFPIAGAVMHGLFKGVGRLFKGFYNLDPTIEDALKGVNQKQADDIGKRTLQIINEVGDVPPSGETLVHSEALAQATKEVLQLKPIPEEVVQRGFDDLRGGNYASGRTVQLAALAERMRAKPFTRAEYAQFAQDVSEDGEYLALRKWGEAPVRTPPSATAKMAEQPTAGGEPDFTVEMNKPPVGQGEIPPHNFITPPVKSNEISGPRFRQKRIQQINKILADGEIPGIKTGQNPRPEPTPLTPEVRTRLEAELARLKSGGPMIEPPPPPEEPPASPAIPPTPPPTPGPLNKVTGQPLSERDLMAEMGGTPNYEDYVGRASGRIATQTAQDIVGQDIPKGITPEVSSVNTALEEALSRAQANPSPVTNGAVADVVAERVAAETPVEDVMDDYIKTEAQDLIDKGDTVVPETPNEIALASMKDKSKVEDAIAHHEEALYAGLSTPQETEQAKRALAILKQRMAELQNKERPPIVEVGPIDGPPPREPTDEQKVGRMSEEDLNKEQNRVNDFLKSEAGAISARAATRLAALSLSGVAYYQAEQEDDPRARAILNYVGGILALGAMVDIAGGKATSAWLRESKYSYILIKGLDLPRIASDGTMKGVKDWQAVTQQGKAFAKLLENKLRPVFPDKLSKEAAMFSLDEGPSAPEWATLTSEQQREVVAQSILNNQMGRILVEKGIISGARVHYVRHLFQDYDTQHLWYSAWEALGTSGQFAKQRQFETLREAIKWAKANGKSEPVMDPAVAQAYHMIEVTKALANKGLVDKYTQLGLLQDFDPNIVAAQGKVAPRDQLRQVRVPNLGGPKMAPDDAATVLERAAAGAGQWGLGKEYVDAFNEAQSQIMRSIMFWAWEHGINVLRGAFALDGTGTAYREALKKIRAADPVIMQASKYLDLFHRPDFGQEGQTLFDKVLASIGQKSPTLEKLGVAFGDFRARGERKLWDEWVPALGLAAWTREMHNWTERTGGKYLPGSPEFEAAAQRAGKFGSDVMGKVPGLVQAPQVQQILRAILFSPQWTRGRIALTAHAAGELTKIAAGEINPRQATYLGYKLRSVLVAAVGMAVGSYLLTRKWPKFNPNTLKFYMNSGVKDKNGREIGIDLSGWWQDDLKLLNEPFNYLRDRQNPMLRTFETQVTGRDVFGRPIQGIDRLDNLLQSFGPPGELILGGSKFVADPHAGAADALRAASGIAAVGNVSSLPRQSDAIVGKYADKLLRMNGIPNDKDRIFELSQLMRRQYAQTGALYGGEVNSWIANQRRSRQRTGLPWLWEEGKRALRQALR